jgi:hypothetical protein
MDAIINWTTYFARVCFFKEFYKRNVQENEDIPRVSKYFEKKYYLAPPECVFVYVSHLALFTSPEDMRLVSVTEVSVS